MSSQSKDFLYSECCNLLKSVNVSKMINFNTHPEKYQHWSLEIKGQLASLKLNVNEEGGLYPGYKLKLNSYDLGVDIELYDAVQRLRFEHPEVRVVVLTSSMDKVFCSVQRFKLRSS